MARILVVDDDPDLVEVMEMVLTGAGHEVFRALSRTAGMLKVAECDPELIVLDVMMEQPDDGFTMARDLRDDGFSMPILMLSSISKVTGFSFDREDSIVPVDEFLEKPIAFDALVERVEALLAQKEG